MKKKIKVDNSFAKMRLDLFLALNVEGVTRSLIKKTISSNNVKVNGEVQFKANYKVMPGDEIEIDIEEVPSLDNVKAQRIKLDVLYEDEDLVVINKPYGMVVHPATGNFEGTLVNALLYKYKQIASVGERIRSGLINRIDKDTSGLVFVGKTNRALWFYSRQFAERQVDKHYLAIVENDFAKALKGKENVTVTNYLGRNPVKRKKFSKVEASKGKLAITDLKKIASSVDGKYSLIEASPVTGRTHQIRVHAAGLGFPVLGDSVYNGKEHQRLMLHAFQAEFNLLTGERKQVTAPLEEAFKKFLKKHFNEKDISKILKY